MRQSILALALLLNALVFNRLQAQETAKHVSGDLLVSLEKGATAEQLAANLNRAWPSKPANLVVVKKVADPMNIWLLHSDLTDEKEELTMLYAARREPGVAVAQFNHITVERGHFDPTEFGKEMESLHSGLKTRNSKLTACSTTPNDPQFSQQWQYINNGGSGGTVDADIDMDLAWDVTTGGLTPDGDTIVVCVVDGGVNINHPDFGDNIWRNWAEIPNNNIDDDGNGYVDDVRGWSTYSNTDNITGNAGHGTCVAGIIGAQGNNGVGVAGVNWDVKIMVVAGGSGTEANAIAGYAYPYKFRKLYNETGGQKGAFVVATNSSWGVDLGQPSDSPLWCAFYDTLGKVGILSCGATANANYNIDTQGDLPTGCPSDWLISVTNCGRNGKKVTSAGYGLTTIDLGSFGENAWTLSQSSYAAFGGTSGATPHVTGTIALMYSAPCPGFIALAKSDPAQAALNLKKYIMDGVKPEATLVGKCITGGRLNANQAILNLLQNCSACPKPYGVEASKASTTSELISFKKTDAAAAVNLRWQKSGAASWTEVDGVASPYLLKNLDPCTDYSVELAMACADSTSGWSASKTFKTDGCCDPVGSLTVGSVTLNGALFSWLPVTAATGYVVEITPAGGSATTFPLTASQLNFSASALPACTEFSLIVHTLCAGGLDIPSAPVSFKTKGCGACTDKAYCASSSSDATGEWIKQVEFSNLVHQNTAGSPGYGDQTAESATVQQYHVYSLKMTPGFSGNTFSEWFRAWIDLNEDGVFTDPGERVYDGNAAAGATVTGSVTVGNVPVGTARMRVSMKYVGGNQAKPQPCDAFNYGQVKDFCVDIQTGVPDCAPPPVVTLSAKTDTTATLTWVATAFADQYFVRINIKGQTATQDFTATTNQITLKNLAPCTEYEVLVWPKCGSVEAAAQTYVLIETDCSSAIEDAKELAGIHVAPNPFDERLAVSLFANRSGEANVELFSASGQLVESQRFAFTSGESRATLDTGLLASGVYFLKVKTASGVAVNRVVKN